MRLVRNFFYCFLLFVGSFACAQKQGNIWIFGSNAGLDFNTYPVSSFQVPAYPYHSWPSGNQHFYRGISVVSNDSGQLLYFSEGSQAWNRDYQYLQNGDSLLGPALHPALLVPGLNTTQHFILQGYRDYSNIGPNAGGFYSSINPTLDNGLGGITLKNIKLGDSLLAMFDACFLNNSDTVLVAFVNGGSNEIRFFKSGQIGFTFHSSIFSRHAFQLGANFTLSETEYGQLKFSSSGRKIAIMCSINKEVLLFDFVNGFDNPPLEIALSTPQTGTGIEFSPNEKFLYFSDGSNLYQIAIDTFSDTAYLLPNVAVQLNSATLNGTAGMMQLAPDARIIFTRNNNSQKALDHIAFPNLPYPNCAYAQNTIPLNSGAPNRFLPSIFMGYLNYPKVLGSSACLGDSTQLRAAFLPADTLFWNFGDGQSILSTAIEQKHRYADTGTYRVCVVYATANGYDSVENWVSVFAPLPKFETESVLICRNDSLSLSLSYPTSITYVWNNGDTLPYSTYRDTGWIKVSMDNGACRLSDSLHLRNVNCNLNFPEFCEHASDSLLFPGFDADSLHLIQGSLVTSLYTFPARYSPNPALSDSILITHYRYGHSLTRKLAYRYHFQPQLALQKDYLNCQGDSLRIDIAHPDINQYTWSTGSSNVPFIAVSSGIFTLQYNHASCTWEDSFATHFVPCGYQTTTACEDSTVIFNAQFQFADSFYWSFGDGSVSKNYNGSTGHRYDQAGIYPIVYTLYLLGDSLTEQSTLIVHAAPDGFTADTLSLCYKDTLFAPGFDVTGNLSYLWHTQNQEGFYLPQDYGVVWVKIANSNCSLTDSIFIKLFECNCLEYIPNAISINNDGLNDVFTLPGNCGFEKFVVRFYSRWGELVFESTSPDFIFDGTYKGKALPDGVYLWIIEGVNRSSREVVSKRGTIHLLR